MKAISLHSMKLFNDDFGDKATLEHVVQFYKQDRWEYEVIDDCVFVGWFIHSENEIKLEQLLILYHEIGNIIDTNNADTRDERLKIMKELTKLLRSL